MGKLLKILGVTDDVQRLLPQDVYLAEQLIDGLQQVYASSPESSKKNQLALAISESVRMLMGKIEGYKIEDKVDKEDDFPYKVGDKFLMEDKYIFEIKKILDDEDIAFTDMKSDVGYIPDTQISKKQIIKNVKDGVWIPIKDNKPTETPKPTPPPPPKPTTPPSQPKSRKSTPPTPPKPPEPPSTPHIEEEMTCEEIKEAILGLTLLAKMGDTEAKETIIQLKNKRKNQNCK